MQMDFASVMDKNIPPSKQGFYAGEIAHFIASKLSGGRLVINIPVEVQDEVKVVDIGWVSDSRLKTLRTEPTWSAPPDIVVNIATPHKPIQEIEKTNHHLLASGAREAWIVWPDGSIERHHNLTLGKAIESDLPRLRSN